MYLLLFCCMTIITMLTLIQARTFGSSAPCLDRSNCPDNHYCETSASLCRQCLQCKDFRREGPSAEVSCVKEVTKCGPCLPGYVDKVECVPSDTWWEHLILPYNWLISSFVFVALVVCVAIICLIWKFRVYTLRTTVSTKQSTSDVSLSATAPAPPPPYNNSITNVPPPNSQILNRDAVLPQIRPVLRKIDACESSEHQNATLSRPPQYGRQLSSSPSNPSQHGDDEDSMPPRYEIATREVSNQLDVLNNEELSSSGSNSVSASVEAIVPDCPTSARKSLRVRQDSTNSDSGEPSGRNFSGRPIFNNQNFTPFIINVIKNDNIIQQNNDVC